MQLNNKQSNVCKFTKAQFLQSRQRSGWERDILAAVLKDDHTYTIAEADKLIQNYLKEGVK